MVKMNFIIPIVSTFNLYLVCSVQLITWLRQQTTPSNLTTVACVPCPLSTARTDLCSTGAKSGWRIIYLNTTPRSSSIKHRCDIILNVNDLWINCNVIMFWQISRNCNIYITKSVSKLEFSIMPSFYLFSNLLSLL